MNGLYYRATLPPVPEGVSRPLWSVMIPTYNCANYLSETISSVLAQDPGPESMQIEVIDDCSTLDDPKAVVEELGQGRVGFYQQSKNVGHIRNFETCLKRSHGQLIHLLHGDDFVKDGFYRKLKSAFENNPDIGAAFCRHSYIDEYNFWQGESKLEQTESGILSDWLERIAVEQCIQTPSIVVRREVYEKLGGFDSRLTWCEDWEMWVRIATHYQFWYEVESLAVYRIHSSSNSGRLTRSGENMRDLLRAIKIMQTYLPKEIANRTTKRARESWSIYGLRWVAPKMIYMGDIKAANIQIKEALKLSYSPKVIRELIPLIFHLFKYHMNLL